MAEHGALGPSLPSVMVSARARYWIPVAATTDGALLRIVPGGKRDERSGMRRFISWFFANLGACPRCMRLSFVAAFLASTCAVGAFWSSGRSVWTLTFALAGLLFSMLWTAHIVTYAARVSGRRRGDRRVLIADPARRAFLPVFARALGVVALATALPPRLALAEVKCASDEWCCRHDFHQDGNPCVKCCKKPTTQLTKSAAG